MKNLDEIKNEVAVKEDYGNWEFAVAYCCERNLPVHLNNMLNQVVQIYTQKCCDEPECVAINSVNDLPKYDGYFWISTKEGKQVIAWYNHTEKYFIDVQNNSWFWEAIADYQYIKKPNTPNVVTTK